MKKLLILIGSILLSASVGYASDQPIELMVSLETNTQAYRISQNIAQALSREMGTAVKLVYRPTERMHKELMDGRYHGAFLALDGLAKQGAHLIRSSEPVLSSPFFAFSVNDNIRIDGWESLAKYKVVYKRGLKFIEKNLAGRVPNTHPVDARESGIKLLLAGRADIFVDAPLLMLKVLQTDEFKGKGVKMLQPAVGKSEFYTYFYDKYKDIAMKYDQALHKLRTDGTIEKIMKETE